MPTVELYISSTSKRLSMEELLTLYQAKNSVTKKVRLPLAHFMHNTDNNKGESSSQLNRSVEKDAITDLCWDNIMETHRTNLDALSN